MARIQQSVEVGVPARVAYNRVTQFEDYPRFMEEVESARQVDDTHVRWTTKIGGHTREWQSEIVEQKPDQCIAWRNVEGPVSTGRVDVQELGAESTRVTFTVESEATSAGEAAEAMARQLGDDLQRLKRMMESGGETDGWRGEVHDGKVEVRGRDAADEVNAEQQSDTVRRTGKLPQQSAEGYGDVRTSEAMQNALQPDARQTDKEAGLDQAIKRAVPPSN